MPQPRQQRRRNPNVIAYQLAWSMSRSYPVRAIFREGGAHDGVIVKKEIDPARQVKDPRKHEQNSNLVVTFDDGFELAVNSIEKVVAIPQEGRAA